MITATKKPIPSKFIVLCNAIKCCQSRLIISVDIKEHIFAIVACPGCPSKIFCMKVAHLVEQSLNKSYYKARLVERELNKGD